MDGGAGLYTEIVPLPRVAEEEPCPACGRCLDPVEPAPCWRPAHPPRWPWILVVLGVCLVVVFGLRAWGARQTLTSQWPLLDYAAGCGAPTGSDPGCDAEEPETRGALAVAAPQREAIARQKLPRALGAMAFGLLAVLVGLGAMARVSWQRPSDRPSPERTGPLAAAGAGPPAVLLGPWAFVEGVFVALFWLVLAGFGYACATQAIGGVPPSWELVGAAADRTAGIVVAVIDAASR